VRVTTPLDRSVRSGIVTWQIGELNPHEVTAALWESGRIAVRVCNESRVRACLHVFNNETDVERTLEAIGELARNGIPAGTPTMDEWKSRLLEAED
jgi:selenocysteine lyase/cysteine desulfurase